MPNPWFGPIANNSACLLPCSVSIHNSSRAFSASDQLGFSLDKINWFGNVVNLAFLPSSVIVPYVCMRYGIRITVSSQTRTEVYHADYSDILNIVLLGHRDTSTSWVDSFCRNRDILIGGRGIWADTFGPGESFRAYPASEAIDHSRRLCQALLSLCSKSSARYTLRLGLT